MVLRKITAVILVLAMVFSGLFGYVPAYALNLPVPGTSLFASANFTPLALNGLIIDPRDPMHFNFIVDEGDTRLSDSGLKAQTSVLLNYFLASLALPTDEIWVNLSPYESDRVVPDKLGATDMGRDLLAQDYILKQLAASLTHPETQAGKKYWEDINNVRVGATLALAQENRAGARHAPTQNFQKVWIVPDKAVIYQDKDRVYVGEAHLKVMMEEDFVAMQANQGQPHATLQGASNASDEAIASKAFKTHILPLIEKDVNTGKNFAPLRQIYHSLLLALWFKKALKATIFAQAYADKQNTKGIDNIPAGEKEKIYQQYLQAFQRGAYDLIKKDHDPLRHRISSRRYFSGGFAVLDGELSVVAQPVTAMPQQPGSQRVVSTEAQEADPIFDAVNAIYVAMGDNGIALPDFYQQVAALSDKLPPQARAEKETYLNLLSLVFTGSSENIGRKCAIAGYLAQANPGDSLACMRIANILETVQIVANGEALAALHELLEAAQAGTINPGVVGPEFLLELSQRVAESDGRLTLADLYILLGREGARLKGMDFSSAVAQALRDRIARDYRLPEKAGAAIALDREEAAADAEIMASALLPVTMPRRRAQRKAVLINMFEELKLNPAVYQGIINKASGDPRIFKLLTQHMTNPILPLDDESLIAMIKFLYGMRISKGSVAWGVGISVGLATIPFWAVQCYDTGDLVRLSIVDGLGAISAAYTIRHIWRAIGGTYSRVEELFDLVRRGQIHPLAADWVLLNKVATSDRGEGYITYYENMRDYLEFAKAYLPANLSDAKAIDRIIHGMPYRLGVRPHLATVSQKMATRGLKMRVAERKRIAALPPATSIAVEPSDADSDVTTDSAGNATARTIGKFIPEGEVGVVDGRLTGTLVSLDDSANRIDLSTIRPANKKEREKYLASLRTFVQNLPGNSPQRLFAQRVLDRAESLPLFASRYGMQGFWGMGHGDFTIVDLASLNDLIICFHEGAESYGEYRGSQASTQEVEALLDGPARRDLDGWEAKYLALDQVRANYFRNNRLHYAIRAFTRMVAPQEDAVTTQRIKYVDSRQTLPRLWGLYNSGISGARRMAIEQLAERYRLQIGAYRKLWQIAEKKDHIFQYLIFLAIHGQLLEEDMTLTEEFVARYEQEVNRYHGIFHLVFLGVGVGFTLGHMKLLGEMFGNVYLGAAVVGFSALAMERVFHNYFIRTPTEYLFWKVLDRTSQDEIRVLLLYPKLLHAIPDAQLRSYFYWLAHEVPSAKSPQDDAEFLKMLNEKWGIPIGRAQLWLSEIQNNWGRLETATAVLKGNDAADGGIKIDTKAMDLQFKGKDIQTTFLKTSFDPAKLTSVVLHILKVSRVADARRLMCTGK